MLGKIEKYLDQIEGTSNSIAEISSNLLKLIQGDNDLKHDEINSVIVSRALHRLQSGIAPNIVVVGMTSAGKSTLINALFGSHELETKATPDTTKAIHRVVFPSGLTIYDTPGIFGDERLENVTRAFLGVKQISGRNIEIKDVPFVDKGDIKGTISTKQVPSKAPIDIVLWVGDLSRTPSRGDKKELKEFGQELYKKYRGRTVVAGTKLDVLRELNNITEEEKQDIISTWNEITEGLLVPVSPVTGEGLDRLVLDFFQSTADNVSLSKMQESLNIIIKLSRTAFVSTQISEILAKMVLLTGKEEKNITATTILLFALIANQYSVDENTWARYNGDALAIVSHVKSYGVETSTNKRKPITFWEKFRAVFGKKFYEFTTSYKPIGFAGFELVFPKIYELIYQFEYPDKEKPKINYEVKLQPYKTAIDTCVKNQDVSNLNKVFNSILTTLINE